VYKHLLVPTDGSALSNAAVKKAMAFAHGMDARVTVLTVIEPFRMLSLNPEQLENTRAEFDRHADLVADKVLREAEEVAAAIGTTCSTLRMKSSDPARAIVEVAASNDCDLIAMASHGREGLKAFMIGSVTMKVLANSKLPVLVYRES